MKNIFVTFVLMFSNFVFSQIEDRKFDIAFCPEIISQNDVLGGANLLIGKVTIEKMLVGMSGVRLGVESNFKNHKDFIIAPKIGVEMSATIFVARLSAINYFQNDNSEFRILPEIGLSLGGFINLTYGYNLRITNNQIDQLSNHRFCLSFNFNKKLIKDGFQKL